MMAGQQGPDSNMNEMRLTRGFFNGLARLRSARRTAARR